MQVDHKRACTACGSESAADASFCWRCLTPFPQVPPPPGEPGGRLGSPLPAAPTAWGGSVDRPRERRGSSKLLGAIVSAVAAFAGYFGVQYLLDPGLDLPDTLAGAERLTDADSKRFEDSMAEQGHRYGIDAEGGVYGSSLGPSFFVILVDAAAIETTDQLFDALLSGFAQAGAVVEEDAVTSGRRANSDYRCVEASAGSATAVACMWRDEGNVGIVLEAPGTMRRTRQLLWTVHDTVVG
jgi:hypothetical protein